MAHALWRKTAQVLLCVFRLLLISTITAAQPSVTYAKPFTLQVSNAPDDDRSGAPVQTAFLFPPPPEGSDQPILGPFGSLGTTFGLNHDGILVDLAIHFFTYPYGDNSIISFNTPAVVDANRDSACICSNGALVFSCTCDDSSEIFFKITQGNDRGVFISTEDLAGQRFRSQEGSSNDFPLSRINCAAPS